MSNTILMTGICGHLGANLCGILAARGLEVRGLALEGEDCSFLDPAVKVYRGDVRDIETLRPMFEGVENPVFIHAAAAISIRKADARPVYDVNVGGTRNVISLCEEMGVARLIYIGSVDSIDSKGRNPRIGEVSRFHPERLSSPYAKSKAIAANLVLDSHLDSCIFLPSGMIGPEDHKRGLMSSVFSLYLNGRLKAGVTGGFDFVDVRDVARTVADAAENGGARGIYILSNTFSETTQLLNELLGLAGRKPIKRRLSIGFIRLFLPLAGLYFRLIKERNLLTMESTRLLGKNVRFSSAKARRDLGYRTRPLSQTLRDFLTFARRQRWVAV